MDLHDIWQEHKRWIIGVCAGAFLFWIGNSVVDSLYDVRGAKKKYNSTRSQVKNLEAYDDATRKMAIADGEKLIVAEERLRTALEFKPTELYQLAGKGDPDNHFFTVSHDVRRRLVRKAQEFGVAMKAKALAWKPPVGREEIESTLFGLEVLEKGLNHLLDAGEIVRAQVPGRIGLQSIEKFAIDQVNKRRRTKRTRSARKNESQLAVTDRIREFAVSFQFRADQATVLAFLEKCRAGTPALTLSGSDFKITTGKKPGEPLLVQGKLIGLMIRDL